MNQGDGHKLVYSIKDRCRVCYTCVRECPVKAIQIKDGQAIVIQERCIACGNCTRVCRQGAKAYMESVDGVNLILESNARVIALVAPSFIAEFEELTDPRVFVGMVRALGFDEVYEVAFGADMVAREYEKLYRERPKRGYISSDCPAIVSYVEKYYPKLIGDLAPIVSPMVATARFLRHRYGKEFKLVFIGPCIAKKEESEEIDEVITFAELRNMLRIQRIRPTNTTPREFNAPRGMKGTAFPISRGMLQTLNIDGEQLEREVIVAEGRVNFQDAIKEYRSHDIENMHLELLCCEGCTMGPGTTRDGKKFVRRASVIRYLNDKLNSEDYEVWQNAMDEAQKLNLRQSFKMDDQRKKDPSNNEIRKILQSMGKYTPQDHLDCGACGYDTCRNHAIAIIKGLAETEMCLPYSIDKLHNTVNKLAVSNDKLLSVQQALKQTEKLAHMGQLSAGIAHELNNPLGVVIMYSNILLDEIEGESPLKEDLELIVKQAERCKNIVGGLLNFARKNQVRHQEVDLKKMLELSVSSIIVPGGIHLEMVDQLNNSWAELDQEQMIQVISNLVKNAVEAMEEGEIRVLAEDTEDQVTITVSDTGKGINEEELDKIFEPFYTTKGIGMGTGLGLATAYGIVKMHKGQIEVQSNADPMKGDTGTSFIIQVPRHPKISNV